MSASSLAALGWKVAVIGEVCPLRAMGCRASFAAFCGQRPCQAGYRRSRAIAAYWQAAAAQTKAWKTS